MTEQRTPPALLRVTVSPGGGGSEMSACPRGTRQEHATDLVSLFLRQLGCGDAEPE